ncbi:MAG: carbamoyltransferase [Acidobacteriia bacterium]|nr:carbamoyltransferase [Terriglobia bacterium]
MNILGISAFYHDSAACLVEDGRITAAAQEERFTRKKHDHNFPAHAIRSCLLQANLTADQLDYVGFYDKPLTKFERLLETYLAFAPAGFPSFLRAMPLWLKEKLWIPEVVKKELKYSGPVLFAEHHESHAASAFYPSPFEDAAILTMDGVGEWATSTFGVGHGNDFELLGELRFPHSLGLLYSAFTYYTGFRVNSGEYKVMGLAPYGEPRYVDKILTELIDLKADGSLALNLKYFNFCQGLTMTNGQFDKLFGGPPRAPETPLTQRDMDLARSIQEVTEEAMLRMGRHVHRMTGQRNLCMAGGVALNCVGNGRLLREGPFENVWIQPAAGDAGGAVGVALSIWHRYLGKPRSFDGDGPRTDGMQASLLGPVYNEKEIEEFLEAKRIPYQRLSRQDMVVEVAQLLSAENVVGWFQGRMEFGPRALGARSILGDPRSPKMQSVMNLKIKFRESFRPFAPAVLREHASDYFDLSCDSPYMLLVAAVQSEKRLRLTSEEEKLFGMERLSIPRSNIPAVTHVDYSARVQTVRREENQGFYDLIKAFQGLTGCPLLINTSFNVRGEPIVCTPADAYRCFMRTEMDYLVMETFLLNKREQSKLEGDSNWRTEFQLD